MFCRFLLSLAWFSAGWGFVVQQQPLYRPPSRLLLSNDDEFRDELSLNHARTDLRNFLTQRSIQSFVFLLLSCRDQATVKWLESTYGFTNLENFHGTGAFNLTKYPEWDTLLLDMLERPNDTITIAAKRRGVGHGGWSKDNPYMEERFVDFQIDIDPPRLVSRILSVRDQICNEWQSDVKTLMKSNDMILTEYHNLQNKKLNTEVAYDRTNMQILHRYIDQLGTGSALRKGSFDLLALLATQESIHRLLRAYKVNDRSVPLEFFRSFYRDRLEEFFDGSQEYGRADDFLEELLLTAPRMKETEDGIELIDTYRIAEDLIAMRSNVLSDWRETLAECKSDHMRLQKSILDIQMGKQVFIEEGFQ